MKNKEWIRFFLALSLSLLSSSFYLRAEDPEIEINLTIEPPDNAGDMGFYAPTSTLEYFFPSELVDQPGNGINATITSLYNAIKDPSFVVSENPLEAELATTIRSLNSEDVDSLKFTLSEIAMGAPSFFIAWSDLQFSLNGTIIGYDPIGDPLNAGLINLIRMAVLEASSQTDSIPYTLYNSGVSSIPGRTVLVEVEFSCPNVDLETVSIEDVSFVPDSGPAISARHISGPIFADDQTTAVIRQCRAVFEIAAFDAIGFLKFTWVDALQRIFYSSRVSLGVIIGNGGTIIGNAGDDDSSQPNSVNSASGSGFLSCGSSQAGTHNAAFMFLMALAILGLTLRGLRMGRRGCD